MILQRETSKNSKYSKQINLLPKKWDNSHFKILRSLNEVIERGHPSEAVDMNNNVTVMYTIM